MSIVQIKKIKIAGNPVYPATILDAIKDPISKITVNQVEQANPNYGKTLREILNSSSESLADLANKIGTVTDLKTTQKTNLVGAINEIKDAISSIATSDQVQANTEAIATLNGTGDGSISKAVSDLKEALIGDATEQGDTFGELENRLENIEKLITDGSDSDTDIIDNITEIITWFTGVKETETGAALISDVAANKKAIGDENSGLIKDVADLTAAKVTISATGGVTDANGVTYKYELPSDVVQDSTYSHITVSSTGVTDAAGNTFATSLSVDTNSTNYMTASGSVVGVQVSTIDVAASGLATSKSVYDFALTADAASNTTEYADLF